MSSKRMAEGLCVAMTAMLPDAVRHRKREEWLADIARGREIGVSELQIAVGIVKTSGGLIMNGHVSTTRANLAGVIASASVVAVTFITLFALGVLVTDATDPAAYGSPASLVWGASGSVMLIAWAALMWFVARMWGARPGEKGWATWTCGLFAYSLPALALALYLFGTGIAIGPRPALIDLASVLLGLTGFAAFVGGCFVGLVRILRPRAGSDYRSA